MGVMHNILSDLKREKIINNYDNKHRYIESRIYKELKSKKKCDYCNKNFSGCIPEIHHKVPIIKGGTNDRDNLMAVHPKCHRKLDAEEGVGDKK